MNDDELDRLADRARVAELIGELDVGARDVVDGMLDAPADALPLLEYARDHAGLKNPGGFVVRRWRDRRRVPLPVWPMPMPLEGDDGEPDGFRSVAAIEGALRWCHSVRVPDFLIPMLERELEQARTLEALEAELGDVV